MAAMTRKSIHVSDSLLWRRLAMTWVLLVELSTIASQCACEKVTEEPWRPSPIFLGAHAGGRWGEIKEYS
jgi:hypothetical protein